MMVHVRIDDLAQPLDSTILKEVTDIYAGIGITLDLQFGSFIKEELEIHGNIQITTLSSKFDAEDQRLAESAVRQLWQTPPGAKRAEADRVVANTISILKNPDVWGYTAGLHLNDPLRSPILIKAPPDDWPQNKLFTEAYDNSLESNKARDIYYYTDVIAHEIGHTFGLNHNNNPLDLMYDPPPGQQKKDQLMEEILNEAPNDDLVKWRDWVKNELASRKRHFSEADAKTARDTIHKFVK
jgi:predicted Zn-dependent protease with MMP-like domain